MAALVSSSGIVTIANTTDTFDSQGTKAFQPQAALFTCSAAGHVILTDANGVVVLELYGAASSSTPIDYHFFEKQRPYLTPIKCSTFTGGGKLRLYGA